MAYKFGTSFNELRRTDLLKFFTGWSHNSANYVDVTNEGAYGNSLRLSCCGAVTQSYYIYKSFDSQSTLIVGVRAKMQYSTDVGYYCSPIILLDSGTRQMEIRVYNDGHAKIVRGGSSVLAVSNQVFSQDTWYYIELKAVVHNSAGSYALRVNGVEWLSDSSVNTRSSSNNSANQVMMSVYGTGTSPAVMWVDDVYALDSTGTVLNDFLGPCRHAVCLPNGAGAYTEWSPSNPASSNWEMVDEELQDGDATYVSTLEADKVDTYTFTDPAESNSAVFAVISQPCLRMAGTGSVAVEHALVTGGSLYTSGSMALENSYLFYQHAWGTNPKTGLAWNYSDAVNAEVGYKAAYISGP